MRTNEDRVQRDQLDAAERVVRAVRNANGPRVEPVVDRLATEWPELAQALGRLCGEFSTAYPESWKTPPPRGGSTLTTWR